MRWNLPDETCKFIEIDIVDILSYDHAKKIDAAIKRLHALMRPGVTIETTRLPGEFTMRVRFQKWTKRNPPPDLTIRERILLPSEVTVRTILASNSVCKPESTTS